ncbi:copper homeostasis protein CutC [Crossiella sp. SN42]|uniref:copper homeostasis protein CutC n=1 Tax=Crossiella sp. SN42 TaxID=2944808 RepID=UPI00207C2A23|nr:copper homeostasis protein CutC [Crossiella sp. SN42]MCO1578195.1 copper homeostasis protein CutC [Crossiella sp. SN42]
MTLLEVIALDARDAEAAQAGGADRLELVSGMDSGGLTPSAATVRSVLAATDLPVRVMLRDAAGYAPADLDRLRRDAAELRAVGATEFVLGFLDGDNTVDLAACRALLGELDGAAWTFHRALDNAADPVAAWEMVAGLGCDTVLAAGSPAGVGEGLPVLRKLADRQASDGLAVLVGGGLKQQHVPELLAAGISGFHVGGPARAGGWGTPVDPDAVAGWRRVVDG